MAKVIEIEFAGVDRNNQPTFVSKEKLVFNSRTTGKQENHYAYFCDIEKLFNRNATQKEILDYYRANPDRIANIIYKGITFDAEPSGEHYTIQIVGL